MSYVAEEIESQPECWAKAAVLAAPGSGLPRRGERVAVVGCGTSYFIAAAYAALRESAGHGETDAFPASELPHGRRYDRVVALTRSGTTSEVLEVLDRLRGQVATVVVTADAGAPAAAAADNVVVLAFADERSVVQTRFATSALVLFRAHLGETVETLAAQAEVALAADLPDEALAAEQLTFLGTGWTIGLAQEAALKLREASGSWTEAYSAMEYRHGPISISAPNRVTWMFGKQPNGLAAEIAATGGTFLTSPLDPLADLVRAQRLAVTRAEAAGLDPDNPRHLSRSVILPAP